MEETESQQTCEVCEQPWDGVNDFCLVCGAPMTPAGRLIQRQDSRGCAFFAFFSLALMLGTAGIAAVYMATRTGDLSDKANSANLFTPGCVLLVIAAGCFGVMIRIALLNRHTPKSEKLQ